LSSEKSLHRFSAQDDIETVDTFLLGLVPFEFFLSDFKKSYAIEPFVEKEMRQAAKLAFEALPSEEKTKFESKAKEHLAAMERQVANCSPFPENNSMHSILQWGASSVPPLPFFFTAAFCILRSLSH